MSNSREANGQIANPITTELFDACRAGELAWAETLTSLGAEINTYNAQGLTPLQVAVTNPNPNLELVTYLLDNGAEINALTKEKYIVSPEQELEEASTALHIAVACQRDELVKLLCSRGADIHKANLVGYTPLHVAGYFGTTPAIIKELIKRGADTKAKDNNDETVLDIIIEKDDRQNKEVAEVILNDWIDHAENIDDASLPKGTLLHYATKLRSTNAVKKLLESGADTNVYDKDQNTPLHLAVWDENREITQLLASSGANIEALNDKEQTPLIVAVENDLFEMACFFISEFHPEVNDAKTKECSFFTVAMLNEDITLIKLLIEHNANLSPEIMIEIHEEEKPLYSALLQTIGNAADLAEKPALVTKILKGIRNLDRNSSASGEQQSVIDEYTGKVLSVLSRNEDLSEITGKFLAAMTGLRTKAATQYTKTHIEIPDDGEEDMYYIFTGSKRTEREDDEDTHQAKISKIEETTTTSTVSVTSFDTFDSGLGDQDWLAIIIGETCEEATL